MVRPFSSIYLGSTQSNRNNRPSPYIHLIINNTPLNCIIDTGSSINLINENYFNFPETKEYLKVQTIKGIIELNKSSKIGPFKQKFHCHKFLYTYDILLSYIIIINYAEDNVTIGNYTFNFQYDNETPGQAAYPSNTTYFRTR